MGNLDPFDRMADAITDEERQNILSQLKPSDIESSSSIHPVDENLDDNIESFEIQIKKESVLLRFFVWFKSILSNTTQQVIYNEYKLSEISHYVSREFPGLISSKQSLLLSTFYERFSELKQCADFFRPYINPLDDNDGTFYLFLSSFVMPNVNEDLKTKTDPYSNPVTQNIPPDTRSNLLRKMENIFDTIPNEEKTYMYQAAKATEWMKAFVKLPFARFITQFSADNGKNYTCPFGLIDSEIDTFARVLCNAQDIPNEFLEAVYMYAIRNSKLLNGEDGRKAGEFIEKAHQNLRILQSFLSYIPLRSITCLVHMDSQWRVSTITQGEDWFVKYKNTYKRIFDQKWIAWESDCKREALLSTLKVNFDLDAFPLFPERPWENLWGGISFAYDSTLGFLNWFLRERFSICELDLKTLLVQGSFNRKENYTMLQDSFGAMVQLSISLQELERKLSTHGEIGSILNRMHDEHVRTLHAQNKVEQIMREIESDVTSLIHKFGDNIRGINKVLKGILGLSKDNRFEPISNLNKLKDKNNEPFVHRIEESNTVIENAIELVSELEQLDKQKSR